MLPVSSCLSTVTFHWQFDCVDKLCNTQKNTEKFLVFFPLPEYLEKPYVNCLFFWIKNRRARIFLVQLHEVSKFLDRKLVSVWKSDVNILYTFQFYVTKFLSPYKKCNRRCDDSLWLWYETRKVSLKNLRSYRIALRYIQFVWLFILKNIQFISLTDKIKNISSFIFIVDFVRNSKTFGRYVQHVLLWKFIKEETIDFMKTKLSLFTWNICKSKKTWTRAQIPVQI